MNSPITFEPLRPETSLGKVWTGFQKIKKGTRVGKQFANFRQSRRPRMKSDRIENKFKKFKDGVKEIEKIDLLLVTDITDKVKADQKWHKPGRKPTWRKEEERQMNLSAQLKKDSEDLFNKFKFNPK